MFASFHPHQKRFKKQAEKRYSSRDCRRYEFFSSFDVAAHIGWSIFVSLSVSPAHIVSGSRKWEKWCCQVCTCMESDHWKFSIRGSDKQQVYFFSFIEIRCISNISTWLNHFFYGQGDEIDDNTYYARVFEHNSLAYLPPS